MVSVRQPAPAPMTKALALAPGSGAKIVPVRDVETGQVLALGAGARAVEDPGQGVELRQWQQQQEEEEEGCRR